MTAITVALADDHPIVLRGLYAVLDAELDITVIGEAGDGREMVELVERLHPDIAVLDLMMPDLDGLEVTRRLRRSAPRTRVIILSMYADEPHVLEALRLGAWGYILKGTSTSLIISAVREVMAGQRYLSPQLSERAVEVYIQRGEEAARERDRYQLLTAREREVLHLIAQGASNSKIAQRLSISPRTAETHRTHLRRKLGLKTQAEIVRYSLKRGLIAEVG